MAKLQSGDLVTLTHKDKEGIGYIYDNGDTENPHLIIGISWKDGGTSNSSVHEALADGVVFAKAELKKTLVITEEIYDDAIIMMLESEILDYFEDRDVDTEHQSLSLKDMAIETGISPHNLHVWLVNMEYCDAMVDITHGQYSNFDIHDRNQFSDSYQDLISDYADRVFPFE